MASKRILAIDDDTDNLELVSLAPQLRAGWRVTPVTDGASGIRMAEDRPDLVLLDVHMPRLRGPEILSALRENPVTSDIPVVLLTASAFPGRLSGLDVQGIISKPFSPGRLPAHLCDLLGWPSPATTRTLVAA